MKHVLGFGDSFISCYRDDMALFKIEFHIPVFAYLSSLWRSSWSTAVFVLSLRAIHIMV